MMVTIQNILSYTPLGYKINISDVVAVLPVVSFNSNAEPQVDLHVFGGAFAELQEWHVFSSQQLAKQIQNPDFEPKAMFQFYMPNITEYGPNSALSLLEDNYYMVLV